MEEKQKFDAYLESMEFSESPLKSSFEKSQIWFLKNENKFKTLEVDNHSPSESNVNVSYNIEESKFIVPDEKTVRYEKKSFRRVLPRFKQTNSPTDENEFNSENGDLGKSVEIDESKQNESREEPGQTEGNLENEKSGESDKKSQCSSLKSYESNSDQTPPFILQQSPSIPLQNNSQQSSFYQKLHSTLRSQTSEENLAFTNSIHTIEK